MAASNTSLNRGDVEALKTMGLWIRSLVWNSLNDPNVKSGDAFARPSGEPRDISHKVAPAQPCMSRFGSAHRREVDLFKIVFQQGLEFDLRKTVEMCWISSETFASGNSNPSMQVIIKRHAAEKNAFDVFS